MTDRTADLRRLPRRRFAGAAAAGEGLSAGAVSVANAAQLARPGLELQGQVAVVTGAVQGIGRASARVLAQQGAGIVVVDIVAPATSRIDVLHPNAGLSGGQGHGHR